MERDPDWIACEAPGIDGVLAGSMAPVPAPVATAAGGSAGTRCMVLCDVADGSASGATGAGAVLTACTGEPLEGILCDKGATPPRGRDWLSAGTADVRGVRGVSVVVPPRGDTSWGVRAGAPALGAAATAPWVFAGPAVKPGATPWPQAAFVVAFSAETGGPTPPAGAGAIGAG